jgi:hypothetical protein
LRRGNIDCIRRIDELEGGAFEDEFRHLMEVEAVAKLAQRGGFLRLLE